LPVFRPVVTRKHILQEVISERSLPGGRELQVTYRLTLGQRIPALLLLPDSPSPIPGAVLVHGYSSRKEDVSRPVGRTLLAGGIASLALDLPLHGSRTDPVQQQSARNPARVIALWREALADVQLGLRYLAARREIDSRRLALVGYSMGSFLSTAIAAGDPSVRALVLAAGGDLPENTPLTAVGRLVADPLAAVKRLGGRPLLMLHGRADRTVRPEQAQRLFDAAGEPKELIWYDSGHRLPPEAADLAARWLMRRLAS
jgi:dienelactone hydrolase